MTNYINFELSLQLPNGMGNYGNQAFMDKRQKLEEHLAALTMGFKKVKVIYDKVNEMSQGLENIPEEVC